MDTPNNSRNHTTHKRNTKNYDLYQSSSTFINDTKNLNDSLVSSENVAQPMLVDSPSYNRRVSLTEPLNCKE